jgi:hypothetical protein
MARVESADHHGSHRNLIWQGDEATAPVKVDAIIVPTARPVAYLKEAAGAAMALGCPLVTLHSQKWTSAYAAAVFLDKDIDLIAIDVPESARLRLPQMRTSELLAGSVFERRTDVSTKRNLGLALSHMLRWERVVFLDDDIWVPNPGDLSRAAGLLDTHAAVGLHVGGFPDNSMVCHAFREAGGWQETFIGGGALAVAVKRNRSFFPNVYNEDWFFVLEAGKRLHSVATVGEVRQYPYDPYRVPRARSEEFGDVLAEGTFWLLDQGKPASDGDLAHWRDFLAARKRFIRRVLTMVEASDSIDPRIQQRMGEALRAALGRCERIGPKLCVDYMKALAADQDRWQRYIQQIRKQPRLSREEALKSLTVSSATPLTWYMRTTSSAGGPRVPRGSRPAGSVSARAPQLPLAEAASLHAAHALEAAEVALAGQKGQAEDDHYGDERPHEQLHA